MGNEVPPVRSAPAWTLGMLLTLALPSAAAAQDEAEEGACEPGEGVTVVVDYQEVGPGEVVVRCVPGPVAAGTTALDALRAAGFEVEGVSRWGDAFVCRIDGIPAPEEELALQSDPGYRETCLDTPPTQASWASWQAAAEEPWTYSTTGARARSVTDGDLEGWTFAVDPGADPSMPRFDPETLSATTTSVGAELAAGDASEEPEAEGPWGVPASMWATGAVVLVLGGAALVTARSRRAGGDV